MGPPKGGVGLLMALIEEIIVNRDFWEYVGGKQIPLLPMIYDTRTLVHECNLLRLVFRVSPPLPGPPEHLRPEYLLKYLVLQQVLTEKGKFYFQSWRACADDT